ncbi:hypothetical protein RRG08_017888 [Elysia crispata]|uniref:Choice-of-anchor I domain-containing protein n=1 Tax=Elysia crispata TaxID=231223 RepID=A0AAE0XQW9_9GAST|nr:hypothetical protein RRG08_017888 [Elysia crispata]
MGSIPRSLLPLAVWSPSAVLASLTLSLLSNIYLPSGEDGALTFGETPVRKIAYSSEEKIVYCAGKSMLHIVNVMDPSQPKIELTRFETNMDFTAIAQCNDRVFITARNTAKPAEGEFRVYSNYKQGFILLATQKVGASPRDVTVREGCKAAVITLEGNPFMDEAGQLVDPEGEILLASFPQGVEDSTSVTIIRGGFRDFDNKYDSLLHFGVRFPSKPDNNNAQNITFSQDMEPLNIVIDEFEENAYVTLKENNAIAQMDLFDGEVTQIMGLGSKKWGQLDASDKDGGPQVSYWPIRSWYQPSGIQFYEWKLMKLLITANEGSARAFEQTNDVTQADLSDDVPAILKQSIEDDAKLGRLKVSTLDGKDSETGKYEQLFTFGGRGFSIWTVSGGPLMKLFDSASQLEEFTARQCPHLFNLDVEVDDCSNDMGSQPNTVAVGELDNQLYIFIGVKNPGLIFVYKLGTNLRNPQHVSRQGALWRCAYGYQIFIGAEEPLWETCFDGDREQIWNSNFTGHQPWKLKVATRERKACSRNPGVRRQ